jgi:hypothetical protein
VGNAEIVPVTIHWGRELAYCSAMRKVSSPAAAGQFAAAAYGLRSGMRNDWPT